MIAQKFHSCLSQNWYEHFEYSATNSGVVLYTLEDKIAFMCHIKLYIFIKNYKKIKQ